MYSVQRERVYHTCLTDIYLDRKYKTVLIILHMI